MHKYLGEWQRTPTVYFTFASTQVEDFWPINHQDANCCGHFVGLSIIKTACFHDGSTLCYFEILGEKLDELPALPRTPEEFCWSWKWSSVCPLGETTEIQCRMCLVVHRGPQEVG